VLVFAAVLATIAFAATILLPMGAQQLDAHHDSALAQSLADGALEEGLANLRAGQPVEFRREIAASGWTQVRELSDQRTADKIELLAEAQCSASRTAPDGKPCECRASIRASAVKDAKGVWRVRKYSIGAE